ncbi:MAG: alpha/beta-type small acid-soluble spore protein [Clostridia bacterium]|nr:alpha/beta-type small acid-soluble spore protein [Clostridia bacterium]
MFSYREAPFVASLFLTVDIFQRKKNAPVQNRCRLKREVRQVSKKSRPELQNMKMEVAREFGMDMAPGYHGNMSAKDNGRVGGQMVKKMIEDYQRQHS